LKSFVEIAADIAREAGASISEFARRRIGFELKGAYDLVTEADRTSERIIVARLRQHFPTHAVMAEEGSGSDGSSEYQWYVDPLDGTTNFAHGFPVYNVSIGLARAGELIAGVIYDPTRDEMFQAEAGSGAFLNQQPIHVTPTARIDDSLSATGFPSRKRHQNINIHFYYQLAMTSHGVRRAGAAAIDLAYVACGRLLAGARGRRHLHRHARRTAGSIRAACAGGQWRPARRCGGIVRRNLRRQTARAAAAVASSALVSERKFKC